MSDEQRELLQEIILIVDDNHNNLRFLAEILFEQGYDIRTVSRGSRALWSIQVEQPDLILLDIKMPDMSGYEVCEKLKADEQTRDIPIIFISALQEVSEKVKGLSLGGVMLSKAIEGSSAESPGEGIVRVVQRPVAFVA